MYCGTLICCGTEIKMASFPLQGWGLFKFFQTGKFSCSLFHFNQYSNGTLFFCALWICDLPVCHPFEHGHSFILCSLGSPPCSLLTLSWTEQSMKTRKTQCEVTSKINRFMGASIWPITSLNNKLENLYKGQRRVKATSTWFNHPFAHKVLRFNLTWY